MLQVAHLREAMSPCNAGVIQMGEVGCLMALGDHVPMKDCSCCIAACATGLRCFRPELGKSDPACSFFFCSNNLGSGIGCCQTPNAQRHNTPRNIANLTALHAFCMHSLFVQAESDAYTLQTATAYGIHFTTWLAATRAALAAYSPCVPLVMAVMATRQRWLKLPHVLKVDMSGYEFYAQDGSLVHLTKAGCCALGAAMALEVVACRAKGSS